MNSTISRLESVPLRELWRHEAHDFTTWLADNLEFVGERLGMDLTLVERESAAGDFSVDILAEAGDGSAVIIENQLERTNHDHLGKLITYMSNLDAKTSIWITREPRPEHEKAIHWLNEMLPADTAFYLLKVEAFRIGDSSPAPLLSIVAGPSDEARQIGAQKKELAQRHLLRLEFWTQLSQRAKTRTKIHARISPGKDNWMAAGAGKSGVSFNYNILMHRARVELYIAADDAEVNERIFRQLHERRDDIEAAFGGNLDWQGLEGRKASRIAYHLDNGGLADQETWQNIQDAMIDAMIRLEKAMKPRIKELKS